MENIYKQIEGMLDSIVDHEIVNFNGVEIKVKKHLSMEEMLAFTDFVVNICFNPDNGEYRPEVRDYAVRAAMVKLYTDIELPEDAETTYSVVYKTGVIKTIMQYASKSQINAIIDAIDEKIAHRVAVNEKQLELRFEQMLSAVNDLVSTIGATFDGVDNDTVKAIAESIAESGIDPDTFVKRAVEINGETNAVIIERLLNERLQSKENDSQ